MTGFVDFYMLPLPRRNLVKYQGMARNFGRIMRKHGATEYREFVQGDLRVMGGVKSLPRTLKVKRGELLIFAVAGFKSKAQRDRINKRVMKDPRMLKMMTAPPLFDFKRMSYGGFKVLVKV